MGELVVPGVTAEEAFRGLRRALLGPSRVARKAERARRAFHAAAPPLDADHGLVRRLAAHPEVLDALAEVEV